MTYADDLANEDWLKSTWDLPATTVEELLALFGFANADAEDQRIFLENFLTLPVVAAAPTSLVTGVHRFLSQPD